MMRADSGRMARKSWRNDCRGDLRQRTREFHAGRPTADDHEREQAPLRGFVGFTLGRFEREQHLAPDFQRIVQGLESGGSLAHSGCPKYACAAPVATIR